MKKIAFLDRDGVINKKAADHCYITSIKDFIFNESIFNLAKDLVSEGFEIVVITNQRGIAKGLYSEKDLKMIHDHMVDVFFEKKIRLLDILYCPHEIDVCDCRKPKDGMLRAVCEKYKVNLRDSILISDSQQDVDMGIKFGIKNSFLVPVDSPEDFSLRKSFRQAK
jgi:D-glycero-D-manno-heptose 1,7-bisphosphate phosphatase